MADYSEPTRDGVGISLRKAVHDEMMRVEMALQDDPDNDLLRRQRRYITYVAKGADQTHVLIERFDLFGDQP